jgi:TPR repeat protein
MWYLSRLHMMGKGVPKDWPEMFRLSLHAAELGFGPAQADVADFYHEGMGTPKDPAAAARWYARAGMTLAAEGLASEARDMLEGLRELSPDDPALGPLADAIRSAPPNRPPWPVIRWTPEPR